jgi:hypothetical protein
VNHDCLEYLEYHEACQAENLDPEVDGAIEGWWEEWWECTVCGERFIDRELKTF